MKTQGIAGGSQWESNLHGVPRICNLQIPDTTDAIKPTEMHPVCTTAYTVVRIPLTRGYWTEIDSCDIGQARHRWFANIRNGKPYACRRDGNHLVFLHRVLVGAPAGVLVDHWDGDTLNNRRHNLRTATHADNSHNQAKHQNGRSSQFKGVCFDRKRGSWFASIGTPGKRHFLGRFDSEEAAARAYDAAAIRLHGEFAWLNFPAVAA